MSAPACYSPYGLAHYLLVPQDIGLDCKIILESISGGVGLPTLTQYLLVFGLTCLLELPFYAMAIKTKAKKLLLILFLCNLATHPFIYLLLPYFAVQFGWNFATELTSAEIFAPLIEILILIFFYYTPKIRATLLILLGNLFSWWAGIYLLH